MRTFGRVCGVCNICIGLNSSALIGKLGTDNSINIGEITEACGISARFVWHLDIAL